MFFTEWEVLIVDDEPDVLLTSRLAMKKFTVYGLPLKIHTATSRAEAIEFLQSRDDLRWMLSVALIDVVMETTSAGLELCEYIRGDMENRITQLFIRTGQPGIATERDVIDRYDINGYFTKVEATEDKLYSLIKSGVRQFLWSWVSLTSNTFLHDIIADSSSRTMVAEHTQQVFGGFSTGLSFEQMMIEALSFPRILIVNDEVLTAVGSDETTANEVWDRLVKDDGTPLGENGHKHVRDEENYHLINLSDNGSKTYFLFKSPFAPPEYMIAMLYNSMKSLATVWQRTAA